MRFRRGPLVIDVRGEMSPAAAFPGGAGRWEARGTTFRQHGLPRQPLVLSDLSRVLPTEERSPWQRLVRVLGHQINNSLAPIKSLAGSPEYGGVRPAHHQDPRHRHRHRPGAAPATGTADDFRRYLSRHVLPTLLRRAAGRGAPGYACDGDDAAGAARVTVLDVRGRAEWAAGHLPRALNIPLGELEHRLGELPPGRPIVVQCQSGARAAMAASLLVASGVPGVRLYGGSHAEWSVAGLPTEPATL